MNVNHWQMFLGNKVRMYIRGRFLANFLNLPYQSMNQKRLKTLKSICVAGLFLVVIPGKAQWGDWGGGGAETPADTAKTDTTASAGGDAWGGGDAGGWGGAEETKGPKMPERKPYVRFVPPYDSLREIIYYEGIIEDEDCEYCMADSLYWRARKHLLTKFGKENLKKFTVEDKKADRITLLVSVPMVIKYGNYKQETVGTLEYKLTLRFKDNRYKYQFGNFVHIQAADGTGKEATRTYHEYYMKLKKGFQATDPYLLAADREVKQLVAELTKTLKEPYQPDEDDW
jgi:hypothetical protein